MWEKPTGTRESCWCRVTKSVGRGPLQPVAGQTSYSVRERNAARLRTWRPRQSHVWFIKGKYEGRANVVMDGDDTEIVAVDAVESAADVLSGTFKPKHLNPAGGHRPNGKQIPVDVLIEIYGIPGGPDWN